MARSYFTRPPILEESGTPVTEREWNQAFFEDVMDPEMDDDADLGNDDSDSGGDYGGGYEARLGHLIVAVLHDDSLDMKAKRKKILKALQLMDDPVDDEPDDDESDDESAKMDDSEEMDDSGDAGADGDSPDKNSDSAECARVFRAHRDPAVRRLAERFDRLRAKERLRSRRAKARRLCERAKLPPAVLSNLFLEQLLRAPDERSMRALIEDRRRLANVRIPRSASAGSGIRMDVKEFAKQLRKGA
jgi:hypothetical protein